jgi:Fe-S cluster assembly protein SufD
MSAANSILPVYGEVAGRSPDGGGCQNETLPDAPLHRFAVPLPVNGEDLTLALPTRRDEVFRYSDVEALATVWPVAAERILIPAGEYFERDIVNVADADDVVVRNLEIVLEAGAKAAIRVLNAGGRLGRITIDVTCHEAADFDLAAVQLAGGKQTVEIVTTVRHVEPGATSRQVVRSILAGQATGSYLGKVAVARDAQLTDSEQSVKAMLLDRTATANAKPELEIYADDVKCAHGCAIGELDASGMFYLMARGIAPADAKRLMLQGFVGGVFDEDCEIGRLALAKLGELV